MSKVQSVNAVYLPDNESMVYQQTNVIVKRDEYLGIVGIHERFTETEQDCLYIDHESIR